MISKCNHNDFGMATANALAGVLGGAKYIGVTVLGLGERDGNAALEEVVMALKHIYKIDLNFKTERFVDLAHFVSLASGRELPAWKAIVGSNMFAHESGIHADGVQKNPQNYEAFQPEEVGLQRQIVLGKHSGTAAVKAKFAEFGIELDKGQCKELLSKIQASTIEMKRNLFDKELMYIYRETYGKRDLGLGQTIIEKILSNHSDSSSLCNDIVVARVDYVRGRTAPHPWRLRLSRIWAAGMFLTLIRLPLSLTTVHPVPTRVSPLCTS